MLFLPPVWVTKIKMTFVLQTETCYSNNHQAHVCFVITIILIDYIWNGCKGGAGDSEEMETGNQVALVELMLTT